MHMIDFFFFKGFLLPHLDQTKVLQCWSFSSQRQLNMSKIFGLYTFNNLAELALKQFNYLPYFMRINTDGLHCYSSLNID